MRVANGRHRVSPPTLTIGTLVAIFTATALVGYRATDDSPASARFVASVEWATWVSLAGIAAVVFTAILVVALSAILRPRPDWGLARAPAKRRYGYLVVAFGLMAGLASLILIDTEPTGAVLAMPVSHLAWRTRGLLVTGLAAAVPWLALVWLAHAECGQLATATRGLPPGGIPTTDSAPRSPEEQRVVCAFEVTIHQLRALWRLMVFCVTAAAISVVIAIITAGALRSAFLAYAPNRADEFAGSTVLLFGAVFAGLQAAIALPLVISWRARARDIVDRVYPLPLGGRPTDEWVSNRARLESVLHLDVPLLRSPLAALSVLPPLLTSLIAAVIPDLAAR